MKHLILFGIFFLSFYSYSYGQLSSPFPSSVNELTLPNSHFVYPSTQILRSMAPSKQHIEELFNFGVTDILIFKNETKDEVRKEIGWIKDVAGEKIKTHHISFRWSQFPSEEEACIQTIEALQIIKETVNFGGKILFHCTVGEDRTGYLAGILQLLSGSETYDTFKSEMCAKGYGRANPNKPWKVVSLIRRDLTTLFLKMAVLVEKGFLDYRLDKTICRDIKSIKVDNRQFACEKEKLN